MSEDAQFPGLIEHFEQRLGPIRRIESAQSDAGNRGYDLTFYHDEAKQMNTVATNGVRFQQITSMLPEEIVCSLRTEQQHIAHYLVDSMASRIIRNRQGMEYGSVFKNDKPIIDGTQIIGVIAHTNPFFDEAFNLFPSPATPKLQIITLVPVTAYELDFVQAEGADRLFEVFWLNDTEILDVHRESAV